jgi:hypothetical protein
MLSESLDRLIENRLDEVTEKCDSLNDKLYLDLFDCICLNSCIKMRNKNKKLKEIELMYLKITRQYVEHSYRAGLKDGLKIRSKK